MIQLRQELTDIKTTLRVSQAQQGDAQKRTEDLWQKVRDLESANKVGGTQQTERSTNAEKEQMKRDPQALVVPDGTEVIISCRYKETDYERVFVPKSVKEIQSDAFRGCWNLKKVVFEAGSALKKIGDYAFCNCTVLKNVQLPDGLETIGTDCFWNSGLEEVVFPASVREIGACAFY